MTQEEKQLLLKDLCARLPYGVILHVEDDSGNILDEELNNIDSLCEEINIGYHFFSDVIQPYLRSMSSMTEEEVKEIQKINWQFCKSNNALLECFVGDAYDGYCSISQMAGILDYLNAHHFDYRGLIPMGLALEAPEDMYD